uniref:G-protein coupled receptors family 1 profile domain-containing protein n=1 Tax=Trichuris muris TaxID=70415 RepID=A0A5S6QE98_TRIMR
MASTTQQIAYVLGCVITTTAYLASEIDKWKGHCTNSVCTQIKCMQQRFYLSLYLIGEPIVALSPGILASITVLEQLCRTINYKISKWITVATCGLIGTAIAAAMVTCWLAVSSQATENVSACCYAVEVWEHNWCKAYYALLAAMEYATALVAAANAIARRIRVRIYRVTPSELVQTNVHGVIANGEQFALYLSVFARALVQTSAIVHDTNIRWLRKFVSYLWILDVLSFSFYPFYILARELIKQLNAL